MVSNSFQAIPRVSWKGDAGEAFSGLVSVGGNIQHSYGTILTRPEWIDPLRDARWSRLVRRHPESGVFHSSGWLQALQRTYGYQPSALVLVNPLNGELNAGIVFCRVESWLTGRRLVSLPFSDHCDLLVQDEDERRVLIDSLARERADGQWKYIELRPRRPLESLEQGFAPSVRYYLHRLSLAGDLDDVARAFHKNHVVRKIRRSRREGIRCTEGRGDALLRSFYRLHVTTRRRHQLPPQPLAWFRSVLDAFPNGALVRVASIGDEPIAAILTLTEGRTATYKYGASDGRWHKSGGMQLLVWKAIQDAHSRGCTVFDMGRSAMDHTGVIAFKEHWGAARDVMAYARLPRQSHHGPLEGRGAGLLRRVIARTPDRVFVAIGRALYPHIG